MSDHFSGPRAIAGPAADICDVYAFPSPDRPGRLVLVMNVLPRATASAFFSDAIVHRFRLRPLTVVATGPRAAFSFGSPEQELTIDITFGAPSALSGRLGSVQQGCCTVPFSPPLAFTTHDEAGAGSDNLRVYAGLRSDPFFFDLGAYQESVKRGQIAFKETGTNSLTGLDVLSVVVETECAPLLASGGPLFAVIGETITAGKLPIRLERVGRPEIKNVMLSWKEYDPVNRDLEVRDLYNLEDTFHLGKEYRGVYRSRLDANLAVFDSLDGRTDWSLNDAGSHPLTDLLLADYLVVDLSKPYAEESFFEIERAALADRPHTTCGGRSLNDDVMDTLLTVLIANGNTRIGDGVDAATVPAARQFPYLASPNMSNGTQKGMPR
jgi:Domain of unknown function (DUF4331)